MPTAKVVIDKWVTAEINIMNGGTQNLVLHWKDNLYSWACIEEQIVLYNTKIIHMYVAKSH